MPDVLNQLAFKLMGFWIIRMSEEIKKFMVIDFLLNKEKYHSILPFWQKSLEVSIETEVMNEVNPGDSH